MKDLKSGYLILLKQKAWLPLKGSHALGNKCSVGPETSISPSGKGQGPTSFSERGLFFSEIGQLSDRA